MTHVAVTILDANMEVSHETTEVLRKGSYSAELPFYGPDGKPWLAVVTLTGIPSTDDAPPTITDIPTAALVNEIARRLRLQDVPGEEPDDMVKAAEVTE